MEKKQNPLQNIRVIIRPAPKKLKVLFAMLLVLCVVALTTLGVVYGRIVERTHTLQEEAAALVEENGELVEKTGNLGTSGSVRDIAREELGLVDPGTVLIDPNSQ